MTEEDHTGRWNFRREVQPNLRRDCLRLPLLPLFSGDSAWTVLWLHERRLCALCVLRPHNSWTFRKQELTVLLTCNGEQFLLWNLSLEFSGKRHRQYNSSPILQSFEYDFFPFFEQFAFFTDPFLAIYFSLTLETCIAFQNRLSSMKILLRKHGSNSNVSSKNGQKVPLEFTLEVSTSSSSSISATLILPVKLTWQSFLIFSNS